MGLDIFIAVNGLPDPELALADRVEVQERMGQYTRYSIHYSVDVCEGDFGRLRESRIDPGSMISILVPAENDQMKCLVKGPVFSQKINLQHGGAGSAMEVRGADSSIKMEREFKSRVWDNMTDSEAVNTIVAQYQLLPDVSGTNARHQENNHSLVQRSNDLQFVRQLASRNGFYFWLSCNALGVETAHCKRPDLNRSPLATLAINQDGCNMQQLEINWDVERPTQVVGTQLDTSNKGPLDANVTAAPQSTLGSRSLRDIVGGEVRTTHVVAPADDGGNMRARGEGALLEADWFINASCRSSFQQLKAVPQLYDLVNVVGAGSRHSGKYLVSGVRHTIDATAHLMDITLIRNGWE